MYSLSVIESAKKLRREGNTYSDIQKILGSNFHKSTLSSWFKDINLNIDEQKRLKQNIDIKLKAAQEKFVINSKKRRIEYFDLLRKRNEHLLSFINSDIQKLLLSILYLGEGAKSKSTQNLSLASSNPKIIELYLSLLKTCFILDNSKFRVRIQCRNDQDVEKLKDYWKDITKIPSKQFYPTYVDKRSIGKPTLHKDYKGVCTVIYFDRSIQLELEILSYSMIEYITKGPVVQR